MVDGTSITDAALARKLEGAVQRDPAVKVRIAYGPKRQDRATAILDLAKRARVASIETVASLDTEVPAKSPPPADTTPVTVLTIDSRGGLLLGARKLAEAELDAELVKLGKTTKKIALRPDNSTPYGTIAKLVDRCKAAGLSEIVFLAN